jgi:hypothetical protein
MPLLESLSSLFIKDSKHFNRTDLRIWAQTEYGKDWQWAYNQMLANPDRTPRVPSGVTL